VSHLSDCANNLRNRFCAGVAATAKANNAHAHTSLNFIFPPQFGISLRLPGMRVLYAASRVKSTFRAKSPCH
jgi:hypothetical protein